MPQSADVLASALQDLAPKFSELFLRGIPLFQYMLGKPTGPGMGGGLNKYKLKGPYKEFTVVTGGPGRGMMIRNGNELIRSERKQNSVRGNEFAALHVYHYQIPGKDLMESGGPLDLAGVIKDYPAMGVAEDKQAISAQIARGSASSGSDVDVGTGADGIFTLNGDQDYNPQGTPRNGLFEYVAPASQTGIVHGLPKQGAANGTKGWFHHYDHVTSMSFDGLKRARALVAKCSNEGLMLEPGGIDLICSDFDTWNNMLEHHDEQVTMIDKVDYPLAKFLNREGFRWGNADWYWDPDINITDTTSFTSANPQLGLAYMLNTKFWEIIIQANNPQYFGDGMFHMADYIPLPDMMALQFRIISHFNLFCSSLRHQACFTGGAQV